MLSLGVIGHPIAHSRSPAMHNAALKALGLDGEYNAFDVAPAGLAAFVELARKRGFRGLNVTIPHKEAALKLCAPDELAARVGAVNTLIFNREGEDDPLRGSNTDVHGFVKLLESIHAEVHGRVLLLGAGGAARAVATALIDRGQLLVASRSGAGLTLGDTVIPGTAWENLPVAMTEATLVVDCTPRGLDRSLPPLDLAPLPSTAVVVDLVVASSTRLTRDAEARGLTTTTGVGMLLHQGAKALELWTGREAPLDVMRAALLASL